MKYTVKITLVVKKTFTYELDERNQRRAEDAAYDKARDEFAGAHLSRHDVEQDDMEIEQLTRDCEECGKEFALTTGTKISTEAWHEDDDYCAKCGAEIEAKEKEEAAR